MKDNISHTGASGPEPIGTVDPDRIRKELDDAKFVRDFRALAIYIVTAADSPAVMEQIGCIRETEFRAEGGGTGKASDMDEYDTEDACRQLVAWDPEAGEIVSMYRFIRGDDALAEGEVRLPTARLFHYSEEFRRNYLPYTIELGRSVVNRSAKKKLHGLYAVWSGLGALISEMPEMKYFFGKVTTYDRLDPQARAILFYIMDLYFKDRDSLVEPRADLRVPHEVPDKSYRQMFSGDNYRADYTKLVDLFSSFNAMVPPLFISYTGLSSTLKVFGTARNPHFGNVMETLLSSKGLPCSS